MTAIAIDGPSGAGKSSLSRTLAQKLGLIYVDTGALYRSIGLAVLRAGGDTRDAAAVERLLPGIHLALRHVDGEQRVFLGEEDVSAAIREEQVSMAASHVSAHPAVRAFLLETQRRIARENNVIMDGRDIGTVVLPDAQVKIFLTASVEDRARRRCEEYLAKGEKVSYNTILEEMRTRDHNDSHRSLAPLKPAADAVVLDTSGNTRQQSVELIVNLLKERDIP